MRKLVVVGLCATTLAGIVRFDAASVSANAQPSPNPGDPAFYTTRVAPILQSNCAKCHSGMNHRGGFSIDTRAALLKGGVDGVDIVPGHPEQSPLMKLVNQHDLTADEHPMPPRSKLADADIAALDQWIRAGAVTP